MTKFSNASSKIIACVIVLILFFFLTSALVELAFVRGNELYAQANRNTYSLTVKSPQRGKIYTRDGVLIADDRPGYFVYFNFFGIDRANISKILQDIEKMDLKNKSEYITKLSALADNGNYLELADIDESDFAKLKEGLKGYFFVDFVERYVRIYPYGETYAHVLGYTSKPTDVDLQNGYSRYSEVGKYGVESYYDNFLRGKEGRFIYVRSLSGEKRQDILEDMELGSDLRLHIDHKWQKLIHSLFADKSLEVNARSLGGGMMIMKEGGGVSTLVSYPSFDPNKFVTGISQRDYDALLQNNKTPLINKMVGMRLSPGSTFKPIVASVALGNGVIGAQDSFASGGCMELPGGQQFCEADGVVLGDVNVYSAIARSSNLYFCNVGFRYQDKYGSGGDLQHFLDQVRVFGLEEPTGIDFGGEFRSMLPSIERVQRINRRDWSIGDMCNTFIGQGHVSMTPVRMMVATHAISAANSQESGVVRSPRIVDVIDEKSGKREVQSYEIVNIHNSNPAPRISDVVSGMRMTARGDDMGSARSLSKYADKFDLRIKTGSADAREVLPDKSVREGAHSWVVGSFRFEGQDYSFVLVNQFGGRGYVSLPILDRFFGCLDSNFEDEICKVK